MLLFGSVSVARESCNGIRESVELMYPTVELQDEIDTVQPVQHLFVIEQQGSRLPICAPHILCSRSD